MYILGVTKSYEFTCLSEKVIIQEELKMLNTVLFSGEIYTHSHI